MPVHDQDEAELGAADVVPAEAPLTPGACGRSAEPVPPGRARHQARQDWLRRETDPDREGPLIRSRTLIAVVALCNASLAAAEPQQPAGKVDAKQLLQSGLKLFDAKDYLGALAVFKDAYARF